MPLLGAQGIHRTAQKKNAVQLLLKVRAACMHACMPLSRIASQSSYSGASAMLRNASP